MRDILGGIIIASGNEINKNFYVQSEFALRLKVLAAHTNKLNFRIFKKKFEGKFDIYCFI